ncbi:MAG: NTP transferase domain-containing protein [Bacteroidetes bacterium]|nr:NTP transferase domain-containing protein [Bacteroidota bacterium]
MKALILSAGLGTRLKPLTDTTPKPLIPYKGKPLIVHQIEKLRTFGISEIIVNVHHLKDKMIEFFNYNKFGVKINLSIEEEILGTGGGIINAEKYLKDESFFLVTNSDIITGIDLRKFTKNYSISHLAVLAVQNRKTSRYLSFDNRMHLKGRADENSQDDNKYAFNGTQVISNKIFKLGYKPEFKDIIDIYIESVNKRLTIKGFNVGNAEFKDIGKPENLV